MPLPWWKRGLDILVAGTALVVLAPIALVVAAVVAVTMGRPVMFRQSRAGLGGELFDIVKFRTMRDTRDENGDLLPDEQRRSRLGNLLRKTSLDELPTLINIVRGEMSLVGPRPLLAHYLDRYTPEQAQRHRVTPGLTGLAQTRGRNTLTWEDKFELDLEYVRTWSLSTDLAILKDTVAIVIAGTGADGNDHTTEFFGTESTPVSQAA
ncbi:MAG: sugar transferase [Actinomycetia bacterium]|nr:sugar transferase [Actinomycetes bacterium]MCP4224688.1 sugar transferase [Actinomycetes bacterium]MCP5031908.1 sugar transferase [Actinomycetes bacterium]